MAKEDILKMVKEDILRILDERRDVSLDLIKEEVIVSNYYINKALKELREEKLIRPKSLKLTRKGKEKANSILKKHLAIEDYLIEKKDKEEAHKIAHTLEHFVSEKVIDNVKKLSTLEEESVPLTEVELFKEKLISDITLPKDGLFERVVSMGISPLQKVKVVGRIPKGSIIKIGNKKFALGKEYVKNIKVVGR